MSKNIRKCPYCGKKVSYIQALSEVNSGEHTCSYCNNNSNISFNKKIYIPAGVFLAAAAIILAVLFRLDLDQNLLIAAGVVIVLFGVFYFLTPLFYMLEAINGIQARIPVERKRKRSDPTANAVKSSAKAASAAAARESKEMGKKNSSFKEKLNKFIKTYVVVDDDEDAESNKPSDVNEPFYDEFVDEESVYSNDDTSWNVISDFSNDDAKNYSGAQSDDEFTEISSDSSDSENESNWIAVPPTEDESDIYSGSTHIEEIVENKTIEDQKAVISENIGPAPNIAAKEEPAYQPRYHKLTKTTEVDNIYVPDKLPEVHIDIFEEEKQEDAEAVIEKADSVLSQDEQEEEEIMMFFDSAPSEDDEREFSEDEDNAAAEDDESEAMQLAEAGDLDEADSGLNSEENETEERSENYRDELFEYLPDVDIIQLRWSDDTKTQSEDEDLIESDTNGSDDIAPNVEQIDDELGSAESEQSYETNKAAGEEYSENELTLDENNLFEDNSAPISLGDESADIEDVLSVSENDEDQKSDDNGENDFMNELILAEERIARDLDEMMNFVSEDRSSMTLTDDDPDDEWVSDDSDIEFESKDEIDDQPEEEPEDEIEDQFEEEPEDEIEDQFEKEPEDEIDDQPEEEPEDEIEDQPEEEPEDEIEDQPEEEPEDEIEDQPEEEPEDEIEDQPEEEPEDEIDEQPEEEPEDEIDEQPEEEPKDDDDSFVIDYSQGEEKTLQEEIDLSEYRTSNYTEEEPQSDDSEIEEKEPEKPKVSRYEKKFPNAVKAAAEEAVENERRRKAEEERRKRDQLQQKSEQPQKTENEKSGKGFFARLKERIIEATEEERQEAFEQEERERKRAEKEARRKAREKEKAASQNTRESARSRSNGEKLYMSEEEMFRKAQQEIDREPRRKMTQEEKAKIIAERARREKQQSSQNKRERDEQGRREEQSQAAEERRRRRSESDENADRIRQKQIDKAKNSQRKMNSENTVRSSNARSLKDTNSVRSSVSQNQKKREQDV